jgi:hypothetical protein
MYAVTITSADSTSDLFYFLHPSSSRILAVLFSITFSTPDLLRILAPSDIFTPILLLLQLIIQIIFCHHSVSLQSSALILRDGLGSPSSEC